MVRECIFIISRVPIIDITGDIDSGIRWGVGGDGSYGDGELGMGSCNGYHPPESYHHWNTNAFELLDRRALPLSDTTTTLDIQNASRFVRAGFGTIQLMIKVTVLGTTVAQNEAARIEFVKVNCRTN